MHTQPDLFTPLQIGELTLQNRLVMAPLTRCRANPVDQTPSPLAVTYYRQRASAGLIVAEATQVSPPGSPQPNTPGIYTLEQIAGWQSITEAVHTAGGLIFLQLWHVGRLVHPTVIGGRLPLAPSAIAAPGMTYTPTGKQPRVVPQAMSRQDIAEVVEQYGQAAYNAQQAGFDGVEIHGANGYLPDQFLQDVSNQREDEYGGSPQNRARFLLEITRAAISVWGSQRVGVRLSPSGLSNGMGDSNPRQTFGYAVEALDRLDLAYLHFMEPSESDLKHPHLINPVGAYFRPFYSGNLITCGGYTRETASTTLAEGHADLIAFGQLFIANPDLPERFRHQAPLNQPDPSTFYVGGERGYIDYPVLAESELV